MKKSTVFIFVLALITASFYAYAQPAPPRSIKVVGNAQIEIVPDEIFVTISLKEFMKDKKKTSIEELETALVTYLTQKQGVAKTDIKMDNMNGYILSLRKRNKEEIVSKSYEVKFKNSDQVYGLYSVMDSLNINNVRIDRYWHSKMDEHKKQVKINAIKAAKEKATYLLKAIDATIGKPLTIVEENGYAEVNQHMRAVGGMVAQSYTSNSYERSGSSITSGEGGEMIGNKTITIRYDIIAEFEIQ